MRMQAHPLFMFGIDLSVMLCFMEISFMVASDSLSYFILGDISISRNHNKVLSIVSVCFVLNQNILNM